VFWNSFQICLGFFNENEEVRGRFKADAGKEDLSASLKCFLEKTRLYQWTDLSTNVEYILRSVDWELVGNVGGIGLALLDAWPRAYQGEEYQMVTTALFKKGVGLVAIWTFSTSADESSVYFDENEVDPGLLDEASAKTHLRTLPIGLRKLVVTAQVPMK